MKKISFYKKNMINTLNESHLHKTLKIFYKNQSENAQTEISVGPYIADILESEKTIIEIQTANLSSLKEKIEYYLNSRYKVKVVYPLVIKQTIELKKLNGSLKITRSPKKQTLYSIFSELTGLYPFLLDKNLWLEIIEVEITEERKETEEKVQNKSNTRRYKKNWIKTDKRLEKILYGTTLHLKSSYIKLIPKEIQKHFCVKDLVTCLKIKENEARLFIWVYKKMNLIEEIEKKGNTKYYSIIC